MCKPAGGVCELGGGHTHCLDVLDPRTDNDLSKERKKDGKASSVQSKKRETEIRKSFKNLAVLAALRTTVLQRACLCLLLRCIIT